MPQLSTVEIPSELVERARAGDRLAQERIYRSLARPVYSVLRRLVVRPAIAEELLQDVFVEVLRSLPGFKACGSFVGWVRSIAVSKALMYLRSPWHRRPIWLDSDDESLAGQAVTDEAPFDSDLARALARLSPVSRAVVWLHDVEEMTHWEIAHLFGRTVSFSKSQLARAHQELRRHLQTAAVILVAAGLCWQGNWRVVPPTPTARTASTAQRAPTEPSAPASDEDAATAPSVLALVQRSQQLEAILKALPSRPAVERAGTSATIDALQSSIALVDLGLTDLTKGAPTTADQRRLWNTRVALLDSLVNVRYAEAASAGGLSSIDSGVI